MIPGTIRKLRVRGLNDFFSSWPTLGLLLFLGQIGKFRIKNSFPVCRGLSSLSTHKLLLSSSLPQYRLWHKCSNLPVKLEQSEQYTYCTDKKITRALPLKNILSTQSIASVKLFNSPYIYMLKSGSYMWIFLLLLQKPWSRL